MTTTQPAVGATFECGCPVGGKRRKGCTDTHLSVFDQDGSRAVTDADLLPQPAMAGTFAMYQMPDAGMMFVIDVAEGANAGTHHLRIPPAMLRAAETWMTGGGGLKALRALLPDRKTRKAIDGRQS